MFYKMNGFNDGKRYQAISRHVVKKKAGTFFEEVTWISFKSGKKVIDIKPMKKFVQIISLDQNFKVVFPDIRKIEGKMRKYIVGPIFDLLTFYVDLNPGLFYAKIDELENGYPIVFPFNKKSSWADGQFIILGEDCIDFRVTFQNNKKNKPLLRVEHIAPESNLDINLPEKWMNVPIGQGKNNWVQIAKMKNMFGVSYGYEYFDVHIYIDPEDGKINYASMYNPVERLNRICKEIISKNKKITGIKNCSEATPQHTYRNITIELINN
ncbi:hypothetical protein ACFL35_17820 [Candidatus Riflebacteria bacterium]